MEEPAAEEETAGVAYEWGKLKTAKETALLIKKKLKV